MIDFDPDVYQRLLDLGFAHDEIQIRTGWTLTSCEVDVRECLYEVRPGEVITRRGHRRRFGEPVLVA